METEASASMGRYERESGCVLERTEEDIDCEDILFGNAPIINWGGGPSPSRSTTRRMFWDDAVNKRT